MLIQGIFIGLKRDLSPRQELKRFHATPETYADSFTIARGAIDPCVIRPFTNSNSAL